jgi:predicted RND superfamily exporter protein
LALLPTALAVGLVLGLMGWLGIRLDLSTALVASVAMGLAVDDTFHCLLRWKQHVRSGSNTQDALRASYAGTGPGVVLSSAAVSLGFLAMMFSQFVPTANFGWLVSAATLGGSLGNLVLLPACLAAFGSRQSASALPSAGH